MAISLLNNVVPLYNYSDFFYDSVPISQVETLYHLSSMLRTSTPRRKFALWNLLKTLCAEIWKVYFSAQIFICFKNGQNRCRVSGQNQVILSHRNSKHFGTEFPPPTFLWKPIVVPHLCSEFHPNRLRFEEVITEKHFNGRPKPMQYRLLVYKKGSYWL